MLFPRTKLRFLFALAAAVVALPVAAFEKTVCTITVNSADEKNAFRRYLPADKYRFVELVERGRPDWLASACHAGVRCDILVISGHYDGGNEFFSDQIESREYLPVAEMERVSCSDSCPGLFSQLKEVYLFGCNTLNPEAQRSASAEVVRSLLRGGMGRADAERLAQTLNAAHGESSRDRMRLVFKDVPEIYGFSSVAPLGPQAAATLGRYFQANGIGEVGSGRVNGRLIGQFATHSMAVTRGMTDADPHASIRRDVCQFADERLSDAQRLRFIHQLLQRRMAEVRMYLDRLEAYAAKLPPRDKRSAEVAQALAEIARDRAARDRYLDFARDADQRAVRVRMLDVAEKLGWLSWGELRAEQLRMIDEMLARNDVTAGDVDLVCGLNAAHELDGLESRANARDDVAHAAVSACLGNPDARSRTLAGLTSDREADVAIAQTYLRHQPIQDAAELRAITAEVAQMKGSDAQVRALQALARYQLSDRESLDTLARLFPVAESLNVQNAIAGVLIRSDYAALARAELLQTLREHRRSKAAHADDVIEALIRRLQQ